VGVQDIDAAVGSPGPAGAWERAAARREIPLDARNAEVTFAVRWMGVLVVRGRFHDVRGVVRVPDGDVARAEVHVDVGAASVRTGISLRDRHLCGDSFLAAARHPVLTFRSTTVLPERPRLDLRALVTVRGVTAAGRLDCATAADGAQALRVVGTGTLSRRAFAVGRPTGIAALNPLYWLIGDRVAVRAEVRVSLD
jgi:polyisoprenoid-binding protein YceI